MRVNTVIEKMLYVIELIMLLLCANSYLIAQAHEVYIIGSVAIYLAALLLPMYNRSGLPAFRLRVCRYGLQLLSLFLQSSILTVASHAVVAFVLLPNEPARFFINIGVTAAVEGFLYLVGMSCVFASSTKLSTRQRACAVIPLVNIITLPRVIRTYSKDIEFELQKIHINNERKDRQLCATKYPILLVHGVFFRDFKHFRYWGRVPEELIKNGARVYYGNHQSASSVPDSAAELDRRIREIVSETGCEKVNVIAHSKGGLDIRYAMHHLGTAEYIASFVTINTPHRGSHYADNMIDKVPHSIQVKIAGAYNKIMKKLGDECPDMLASVFDLKSDICKERDNEMPPPEGVYCISFGSRLNKASGARFPLNWTYGEWKNCGETNDGLVGVSSFSYGEEYTLITVEGERGVGHGDMIDINKENFDGFDVREFYVGLVNRLKEKGL